MVGINRVATIHVGGKKLCIAHTDKGFFAISDRCPHNGASLGTGHCTTDGAVVCPVHRYSFDLVTGRARAGLGDAVRTYKLMVADDGIYIEM